MLGLVEVIGGNNSVIGKAQLSSNKLGLGHPKKLSSFGLGHSKPKPIDSSRDERTRGRHCFVPSCSSS